MTKLKTSAKKKPAARKAATPKKPTANKAAKTPARVAKPRPIAYARMKVERCPTILGTPFGGGFFGGDYHHPDGTRRAIVIAPKALGEHAGLAWKKINTITPGADSLFDSLKNSEDTNNDDHPAAQWCRQLVIGGKRDWALPSLEVMGVLRRNFMPGDGWNPGQTLVEAFKEGGREAFSKTWYWTSTQASASLAWCQHFGYGSQRYLYKFIQWRARAVREIILI